MSKEAVKITITYKDGSKKDLKEGISFITYSGDIVSLSVKELLLILSGVNNFGIILIMVITD